MPLDMLILAEGPSTDDAKGESPPKVSPYPYKPPSASVRKKRHHTTQGEADGLEHPAFICDECNTFFPLTEEREVTHPLFGLFFVCGDCYAEASHNGWVLPNAFTRSENYVMSPDTRKVHSTRSSREIDHLKKELVRAARMVNELRIKMRSLAEEQHERTVAAKEALAVVRKKANEGRKKQAKWRKEFLAKQAERKHKMAEKVKKAKSAQIKKREHEAELHRERAKRWREKAYGMTAGQREKLNAKKAAARLKKAQQIAAEKQAKKAKREQQKVATAAKQAEDKLNKQAARIVRRAKRDMTKLGKRALKIQARIEALTLKLKDILPQLKAAEAHYKSLDKMTPKQVLDQVKSGGKKAATKKSVAKKAAAKKSKHKEAPIVPHDSPAVILVEGIKKAKAPKKK